MKYYMPAKIWEEKDCIAAHASEIAAMGKNALLVTGRRSAERNGSLKDVQKALEHYAVLRLQAEKPNELMALPEFKDLNIKGWPAFVVFEKEEAPPAQQQAMENMR